MKDIDKYNAPRGCYAVAPEEFSLDGIGECNGCCFDSGDDSGCMLHVKNDNVPAPCWAEGRTDEHDVIFKRDGSSGDGDAVALDGLKKSLGNLHAAWKAFQQHKEAAKTLHHH